MKNVVIFFSFVLFAVGVNAGTIAKTVNVSTPGTLSLLLTATEKTSVTDLTLTGSIDVRDVKCMRDEMPALSVLDATNTNIEAYTGAEGTSTGITLYPAAEMPAFSFFNSNSFPSVSKTSLTCVKLPLSITAIGDQAFFQCSGLTRTLTIPDAVKTIGNSAFQECTGLTGKLIIPDHVITIKSCAFGWCSGFTELVIGRMVTSIEGEGFTDCWGLKSISVIRTSPPVIAQNSFGFDKSSCMLYVPVGAGAAYTNAEHWQDFIHIAEISFNTATDKFNNNHIKIYGLKAALVIDGTQKGDLINICSLDGKALLNIKSQGERLLIPVTPCGIYFVKVGLMCKKVKL